MELIYKCNTNQRGGRDFFVVHFNPLVECQNVSQDSKGLMNDKLGGNWQEAVAAYDI